MKENKDKISSDIFNSFFQSPTVFTLTEFKSVPSIEIYTKAFKKAIDKIEDETYKKDISLNKNMITNSIELSGANSLFLFHFGFYVNQYLELELKKLKPVEEVNKNTLNLYFNHGILNHIDLWKELTVKPIKENNGDCKICEEGREDFWSLYVHTTVNESLCIADLPDKQSATDLRRLIIKLIAKVNV